MKIVKDQKEETAKVVDMHVTSQVPEHLLKHVKAYISQFVPLLTVYRYVNSEISKIQPQDGRVRRKVITDLIRYTFFSLERNSAWKARIREIFDNKYPLVPREYIDHRGFVSRKHKTARLGLSGQVATFRQMFISQAKISGKVAQKMAPALIDVVDDDNKEKLIPTAELERFKDLETKAIKKGAVPELYAPNRPIPGIKRETIRVESSILLEVHPVRLTAKKPDNYNLLEDFKISLSDSFSWADEEDLGAALAYLLMPMLANRFPGQLPLIYFSGEKGTGKTTLARTLPNCLYNNGATAAVYETRLAKDDYEFGILLSELSERIYLVFDEIADAQYSQLKIIDQLATAQELHGRVLRQGRITVPNEWVVGLTAVSREFTEETQRRIIEVVLTTDKKHSIGLFLEKWRDKWPAVLSAIYHLISELGVDNCIQPSTDQQFTNGYLAVNGLVQTIFGIKLKAPVLTTDEDLIQVVLKVIESGQVKGVEKGRWKRFSFRELSGPVAAIYKRPLGSRTLQRLLEPDYGFGNNLGADGNAKSVSSTEGRSYFVKIKSEGQKSPRKLLMIREA